MKHTDVRSVGCERLCLQALEDLQLSRTLEELGMSELDTRRALALGCSEDDSSGQRAGDQPMDQG